MTVEVAKLRSVEHSRPVSGEPLALDLINTTWPDAEGWRDVLANRAGHEEWLRENDLPGPRTAAARRALLQARDTIRAALERPGPGALAALDGILERGRLRIRATEPGAAEELEIERELRVPWLAVRSLLRLLDEHPARVRKCANPDCPFWFLDTTRSGTRRWCSMTVCGNRLKARRHYRRQHRG
jgi:predicted RNA-binding Zn ribbon-like protein